MINKAKAAEFTAPSELMVLVDMDAAAEKLV